MPTDDEVFGPQTHRFPVDYEFHIHDPGTAFEESEDYDEDETEAEYEARLEAIHGPSLVQKKKPGDMAFICCYPSVLTLGSLTIDQADGLFYAEAVDAPKLANMDEVNVELDYPFGRKVTITIHPMLVRYPSWNRNEEPIIREEERITVGLILWQVALAYRAIYEIEINAKTSESDPGPFEIWGHGLGDLVFEAIDIFEDGYCRLFIGS